MAYSGVLHLFRRGEMFIFRMAVPRHLWPRIRLREIKGSLKTRDPFTARMRCRSLSNAFERLIDRVAAMPELTYDSIRKLIRDYFQKCLNKSEETAFIIPDDPKIDVDFEVQGMREEIENLQKSLARKQYSPFVKIEAEEILEQAGHSPSSVGIETRDLIRNGVLRAQIEDHRVLIAKLEGQYENTAPKDPLFAGMEATGMPPIPGDKTVVAEEKKAAVVHTLGTAADLYCAMKKDKEWVGKTYGDHRRTLNLVIDVIGADKPITSLEQEDVRQVRDTLMKLPSNYMKSKAMQGKSLKEVLASDEGKQMLSLKTQDKYYSMFRTFLNWCVAEEYIVAAPGAKIKITGASKIKANAQDSRHPFSEEQLAHMLTTPLYTGCLSETRRSTPGKQIIRDGKFWIPLIGLYSGLRLGEIVQLRITDIKTQDGIAYFDIARGEGEEDKQLKTWSSRRQVPVHPALIDAGFLVYVEKQRKKKADDRIFPDIKPGGDGYYSALFSKWFSRYLKAIGIKTDKTSFHSFRHNFKDALVLGGVSEAHAKALMGHADDSVHSAYGSKVPMKILSEAIGKTSYPIDSKKLLT